MLVKALKYIAEKLLIVTLLTAILIALKAAGFLSPEELGLWIEFLLAIL